MAAEGLAVENSEPAGFPEGKLGTAESEFGKGRCWVEPDSEARVPGAAENPGARWFVGTSLVAGIAVPVS